MTGQEKGPAKQAVGVAPEWRRVAVVGDAHGVPVLLETLPSQLVTCLIAASNRPVAARSVETLAQQRGLPCLVQPRVTEEAYPAFVRLFQSLGCTGLVCHSYSMLLRQDLLECIGYNAVNVHAALLPRNRGPNPVQWAIIRGESETGVTLHYLNDQLDAGDIIAQRVVPIIWEDTWTDVLDRVVDATECLLREELPGLLAGTARRSVQDEAQATRNRRLTPDSPRIDFERASDQEIYNLIRAQVHPLKGAYVIHRGERVHIDRRVSLEEIAHFRRLYHSG